MKRADDPYTRECDWDNPADVKAYQEEWKQIVMVKFPNLPGSFRSHWRTKKRHENAKEREKHRNESREYQRILHASNPQKLIEMQARWRRENLERHRASVRRWKIKNPYKVREGARANYTNNAEREREKCRLRRAISNGRRRELDRARKINRIRRESAARFLQAIRIPATIEQLTNNIQ